MTIAVLQQVQNDSGGSGGSIGVAITCAANSSLHVAATVGGGFDMAAANPITNTGAAIAWSAELDNVNDPLNSQRVVHYKADGVPAQTTTITANFNNAGASFIGILVKEIGGTSGYDAAASAHAGQQQVSPTTGTDATTSGNTPALTSQPALISGVAMATAAVATTAPGTGFTNDKTGTWWEFGLGANMAASESKRVTSTSALAASFTAASNDSRITLAAVFLESVAGPTVNTQPQNATVYKGQTANFTVAATTSGGTLHYQWKDDGSNVGTDSNSYTTAATVDSDNGAQITCDVTDDNGTTASAAATLKVLPAASAAWISA